MFADRLQASIEKRKSFLIAGFDPQIDTFPQFILDEAIAEATSDETTIYFALVRHYTIALNALEPLVAAIKPNIAFFEQYGFGGLRAFSYICDAIKERGLPCIIDAKRGDIGHTATAYSRTFLGRSYAFGKRTPIFDGDALTVNPYLGFDTLEPYLNDCREFGKGIFVLVKTSNPSSSDIQGIVEKDTNRSVSDKVAEWCHKQSAEFTGSCGFSGIGAVVGATYPEEALRIRSLMPNGFFLIPGLGSQGGSAEDAKAGFVVKANEAISPYKNPGGAIVNVSRGLFKDGGSTVEEFSSTIASAANKYQAELSAVK